MIRILAAFILALTTSIPALATADGPDAWRVTGIAAGDTLNVRMGPGTDYMVIGTLQPDARGLQSTTCVPYVTFEIFDRLSEADRAKLPQRWCLVTHAPSATTGWVSGKFLTEDSDAEPVAAPVAGDDPQAAEAMALVSALMSAVKAQESGGPSPLQEPLARDFFVAAMIPNIDPGMLGADPIVGGQDAQLADITVEPDPEQGPLRGSYPVRATFTNFGQLRTVTFHVRVDTDRAPAMRIISFEADGETYQ